MVYDELPVRRHSGTAVVTFDVPCPGPLHFLILLNMSDYCPLHDQHVGPSLLSLFGILSILLSISVCAAVSLFCACLASHVIKSNSK